MKINLSKISIMAAFAILIGGGSVASA